MRSTYLRTVYAGSATVRTRDRSLPRPTYSTAFSTLRSTRSTEPTYEADTKTKDDDSDSEAADTYADLRSKLRALQREATQSSSRVESLEREKEEIAVALGQAKRDKAKASAETEAIGMEKDSVERDNRRLKTKLEAASRELREINDERRQLSEKLKVLEVLKRTAVADDKDAKEALAKLQDEVQSLRSQNVNLEDKLAETQDQLRRSKFLQSITASAKELHSVSEARKYENTQADAAPSAPRISLALSSITRDRISSYSSDTASPPSTPSHPSSARLSSYMSPTVKTDAFRVEHLKVELESAKKEFSRLQENNQELTKKLREAEKELLAAKSANRELASSESSSASAAKSASKRADDADYKRKELLAENSALREAESKMRMQVEQAHRDLAKARDEAAQIRTQVDRAEATLKKESDSKNKIAEELAAIQRQLQDKESEQVQIARHASKSILDLKGSRDEVTILESRQAKLEREVHALNTQVAHLTSLAHEKQVALEVAQNEIRSSLERIKDLSSSLSTQEEAQKKVVSARKKAEDRVTELELAVLEKEHAREAAASELERRKKDLDIHESEISRLKTTIEFMEKTIRDAKQSALEAQTEASEAKHRLDRVNSELQATSITIDQLQREIASNNSKAVSSVEGDAHTELQLRLLTEQLTTSQREKTEAETKYNAAEKEKAKFWTDIKALQTELNMAKSDLQMGGRIVGDLQAKLKGAEDKLAKSEEDSRRLHEKQEKVLGELRTDLGHAKKEIKIKDGILSGHQTTIAELSAKLKAATSAGSDASAGNHSSNGASVAPSVDVAKLQSDLQEATKSLEETQSQLTSTKHSAATMAMKIQAQQSTIEGHLVQLKANEKSVEEIDKLRRELELSTQLAETSKTRMEKLQSELEKTKAEAAKQAKSDSQLRKTLSKQCEQWQHSSGAFQARLEKIKKEMAKNTQLRTFLEPIIGAPPTITPASPDNHMDERTRKVITIQAYCRGALERKKNKHWRYRYLKMKEMVDSEESYLKTLDLGWSYFLNPLQALLKLGDGILTQDEVALIFTSLEDIRKNNKEVLALLRSRLNTWHINQLIGDVFNDILSKDLLKPHVVFAQSYSKSTENRVRITKENVGFSRLLAFIRMMPPLEGRSLEDILISPIQRIPRYILLLNDMVKHTLPDHPDFSNLRTALEGFQQFATFINENNRRAETMTDINVRLIGYDTLPENPSRKLLHEGRLTQINKNEKIPRYVFLFSDFVVFGKESKNKKGKTGSVKAGVDSAKVATKFVVMIKIGPSVSVSEIGNRDVNGSSLSFLLNLMVGENSNLLQATSESDMKLWVGKMKEAIEEAVAAKSTPKPEPLRTGSASDLTAAPVATKDRSKRLSVGAPSSSGNTSPTNSRAVSPARTASLSALPVTTPSIPETHEEIHVITAESPQIPTLQASSSSGSLDATSGAASRKSRTLSKRHRGEKGGSRAE